MPNDANKQDDDFFGGFNNELQGSSSLDGSDPFASFDNSVSGSADLFASLGDRTDDVEPLGEPELTSKGKKAKKEKGAKKEKRVKEPKEKTPKAKREKEPKRDYVTSPAPVFFLLFFLIFALLVANAVAFMLAGVASATYLVVLDFLGLLALLVPIMLLSHLRQRPISLFDFFLALAAIFSVVSTLMIVSQQAKDYGASSKVASIPAVVSTDAQETLSC